jgi:selT/selW/selH-like putative selenoprotein
LKAYKRDIDSLVLVPSDGGCFEVKKNGKLVFSKLAAGRFPEDGEVGAIFTGSKQPVVA